MPVEDLAKKIRVLVLDVDGVLTDGGLYYDADGRVMKRFHVQDGLGIKLAQSVGLEIAVITGLDQPTTEKRVRELGITHYFAGHHDKLAALEAIRVACGVEYGEMAFLGDDWVDVKPLKKVGLPMCVANAQPEIPPLCKWRSATPGGQGAVREAIRFLLGAQGRLEALLAEWGG